MRTTKTSHKLVLAAASVTALAGVVSAGSYATWADAEASNQDASSGSFQLAVNGQEGEGAVTMQVENMAPGDRVARAITLSNTGSIDIGSIGVVLSGTQSEGSALLDGTSKGLFVDIRACEAGWVQTSLAPSYAVVDGYACGTVTDGRFVRADWDTVMKHAYDTYNHQVGPKSALQHGEDVDVLVTLSLPAMTGDDARVNTSGDYAKYGDKSASVTYAFTATQRAATLTTGTDGDANPGSVKPTDGPV